MIQIDKLQQIREYVDTVIKEELAAEAAREAEADRQYQLYLKETAQAPRTVLVRALGRLRRCREDEPEIPALELALSDWLHDMPDLRVLISGMQKLISGLPVGDHKAYYIIKDACRELIRLHAAATASLYQTFH